MSRSNWYSEQIDVTEVLIKFFQDHDLKPRIELVRCLECIKADDIEGAVVQAKQIKPWGMGGLDDNYLPVKFSNENQQYVQVVLEALIDRWCHLMSLSFEKNNPKT
jgi:hypothetical protein